jgi:NTP pyrophosphatase (non-canonical NTP hydrolase)
MKPTPVAIAPGALAALCLLGAVFCLVVRQHKLKATRGIMLEQLWTITSGLNQRFPEGNTPFQIMTRLLEECGELAQMVNHLEGSGVKYEKRGHPDPQGLAKEVQDVLRCALQIAQYYGIEAHLEASLQAAHARLQRDGYIP